MNNGNTGRPDAGNNIQSNAFIASSICSIWCLKPFTAFVYATHSTSSSGQSSGSPSSSLLYLPSKMLCSVRKVARVACTWPLRKLRRSIRSGSLFTFKYCASDFKTQDSGYHEKRVAFYTVLII
jgi:hypothetical protein